MGCPKIHKRPSSLLYRLHTTRSFPNFNLLYSSSTSSSSSPSSTTALYCPHNGNSDLLEWHCDPPAHYISHYSHCCRFHLEADRLEGRQQDLAICRHLLSHPDCWQYFFIVDYQQQLIQYQSCRGSVPVDWCCAPVANLYRTAETNVSWRRCSS